MLRLEIQHHGHGDSTIQLSPRVAVRWEVVRASRVLPLRRLRAIIEGISRFARATTVPVHVLLDGSELFATPSTQDVVAGLCRAGLGVHVETSPDRPRDERIETLRALGLESEIVVVVPTERATRDVITNGDTLQVRYDRTEDPPLARVFHVFGSSFSRFHLRLVGQQLNDPDGAATARLRLALLGFVETAFRFARHRGRLEIDSEEPQLVELIDELGLPSTASCDMEQPAWRNPYLIDVNGTLAIGDDALGVGDAASAPAWQSALAPKKAFCQRPVRVST